MNLSDITLKIENYIIEMRREFHMYPELSYKEERTSKRVGEELDKMGVSYELVQPNIVIATIKGSQKGKTIGVRADMDALPMKEESDVLYKSRVENVMHSCGHDAHTAMLLGVAHVLNEVKEELKGTVKLIFQVAEEVGGGVKEITEHLNSIGGLDRLIGLHVWADIESGFISVEHGARMAGGIFWEIEVKGKGGHGSRPDKVKDPIKAACDILLQISSIPANRYNALEPCVVSPGMIHGGTALNVIPDTVKLAGTIRYFSYEGEEKLQELVKNIAENTAKSYGVEAECLFYGHVIPVINDEESVALAKKVVTKMDGLELDAFEPICACDCFGYLLQKYPGCYCYLGIKNSEKGIVYPQHHSMFDIDESAMRLGCEFICQYVIDFFEQR